VECPICQKRVKEASINSHIDQGCMDAPRAPKSLGRSSTLPITSAPGALEKPIKRPERLPQLNYQFVKDPALKRKLIDTGLSAGGTRQLLERRYTEWVTLWNANCDATRPKSKVELKRELDIWERTQGRNTVSVQGAQIKDKDFDGKGWSNTHDSDFKDLIAKARAKVALKSQTPSSASTPLSYEATRGSTPNQTTQNEIPSLYQANMEMHENNNISLSHEASQELPTRLERRFFDENSKSSEGTLSSQYAREVSILKTDASIASDMTTSQTLQP
jgi:E3 ubiquitin-protein ligase RAD18